MKPYLLLAALAVLVAVAVWQPVQAQGAKWGRDIGVISERLDGASAEAARVIQEECSQEVLDKIEARLFPEPVPAAIEDELKFVRRRIESLGLQSSRDIEYTELLTKLDDAITKAVADTGNRTVDAPIIIEEPIR
jgi:hypothetical protein